MGFQALKRKEVFPNNITAADPISLCILVVDSCFSRKKITESQRDAQKGKKRTSSEAESTTTRNKSFIGKNPKHWELCQTLSTISGMIMRVQSGGDRYEYCPEEHQISKHMCHSYYFYVYGNKVKCS